MLVSSSSAFVPSFAVSSTLIYCCISVSLFSFSYSFPVLLVCCFLCLFSFVSSPVIVFTCASFSPAVVTSPVSCQCSVSIYSPVLPLSKHLFVSLWLYVPATQTFWGVLYFDSVSVWILFWSLKPKFGSKTSYFRHIQTFICPCDAPSTWSVCTEGWLLH